MIINIIIVMCFTVLAVLALIILKGHFTRVLNVPRSDRIAYYLALVVSFSHVSKKMMDLTNVEVLTVSTVAIDYINGSLEIAFAAFLVLLCWMKKKEYEQ